MSTFFTNNIGKVNLFHYISALLYYSRCAEFRNWLVSFQDINPFAGLDCTP